MADNDDRIGALRANPPYAWEDFAEAGRRFAQSAAANFSSEDSPFFFLHAGAAVELLVKATLCRSSPVLLLEGSRFSETTLIRFAGFQPAVVAAGKGQPSHRHKRSAMPHTVGFSKAIERLGLLYGTDLLGVTDDQVEQLKASRDLVAHASHGVDEVSETMHNVLLTLASVTRALLKTLELDPSDFWGDNLPLIDRALDTQRDAISSRIDTLYAAARARYERQFQGIDPAALQSLKEEAYWAGWSRGEGSRDCPVCDAKGFSRERPKLRRHVTRRGRLLLEPGFEAIDFRCTVCKLTLESEQLVQAARNFDSWEEEIDDIGYWIEQFGAENLDTESLELLGVDWYEATAEDDGAEHDQDDPA